MSNSKKQPHSQPQSGLSNLFLQHQPLILNIVVIIGLLIVALTLWLPTRYLPFHWDAAGFVAQAANNFINSKFHPLIPAFTDFSHPPLFVLLVAVTMQLFESFLLPLHLLIFPFLPLLSISTYFIGKKAINPLSGIIASFLVTFTPVVIAEYGNLYIDLPMAALATLATALWLYRYQLLSMISLSTAVLIKLLAIFLLPMFTYWQYRDSHRSTKKKVNPSILLIPFLVIIIWLLYHYLSTGWIFSSPQANMAQRMVNNPTEAFNSTRVAFSIIFYQQFRWLFSLLGLSSLIYLFIKDKSFFSQENTPIFIGFLISLVNVILLFIISAEFTVRYSIFVLPYFYLILLWLINGALRRLFKPNTDAIALIVLGIIIAVSMIFSWHPKIQDINSYNFRPSNDLSYQDIIRINRELGVYLNIFEPQSHIFGGFPENLYLTNPYLGYSATSSAFSTCRQFQPDSSKRQLIVIHPYSGEHIYCRQLLDAVVASPIRHFESNDKWLELYEIDASASGFPLSTPPETS